MELWEQQVKFAQDIAKLIDYMRFQNYLFVFGEAYIPEEENNLHGKRLAIDIKLLDQNGKYLMETKGYKEFGLFWESLDKLNIWGGHLSKYPDSSHFQRNEV